MPKIFIVYNDHTTLEQVKRLLFKLGIEPSVLRKIDSNDATILEIFLQEVMIQTNSPKIGIVLLTPDDIGYENSAGKKGARPRARQKVVFAMGMLIGALLRKNIIVLKQQDVEVPLDDKENLYLSFKDHVKETFPKLVKKLSSYGFQLNAEMISGAGN